MFRGYLIKSRITYPRLVKPLCPEIIIWIEPSSIFENAFDEESQALIHKNYVRDVNGALRVGAADVSLDSVVMAFQDGLAPEAIQLQYPVLTLEEIYGAITYYLANRVIVDEYLVQQSHLWADLRRSAEQNSSSVVARLRVMAQSAVVDPHESSSFSCRQ